MSCGRCGKPSPPGAGPPQDGAGRGNYWADTLTQDNEIRQHGAHWLSMVGLNAPGQVIGLAGCGGAHTPAYPGQQVFPTCADYNDPPQGPTDQTGRCASCWWVQNTLPTDTSYGLGGAMEGLSHGGRRVAGFGLGAVGVLASLTQAQQVWVVKALAAWIADPGVATSVNVAPQCSGAGGDLTQAANFTATVQCFQYWYNTQTGASPLPVNGTLDQLTLTALVAAQNTAANGWGASVGLCPGNCATTQQQAAPAKSNTLYYVLGSVAAVLAAGGIYAATRKKRAVAA